VGRPRKDAVKPVKSKAPVPDFEYSDNQEQRLAIYDGASINQLSAIFGRDDKTISKLIRHVKPSGKRHNKDIYSIKEAARYLVEPVIDEETFIRTITRTQDLPPYLQKEFWAAQLNRQKYQIQEGELWPTDKVLAVFNEVFKRLKMTIRLFEDTIEARTELSQAQRKIVREMSDGLQDMLRRSLIEGDYEIDEKSEREKVISDAD